MNDYDKALAQFLDLWVLCNGDPSAFCHEAQIQLGYTAEEVDWINAMIGSAQFRGAFGNLVGSHNTDCEQDPWFQAAQRRFPVLGMQRDQ